MRIAKVNVFIAVIAILSVVSCASTKEARPLWSDDTTLETVYPNAEYIARIASSPIEASSSVLAESELTKYFSHKVTSDTKAYQHISNDGDKTTTDDREIVRTVSVDSSMNLFAVSHTTPWFDKKTNKYICCAYINRAEAWKMYEPVVLQKQKQFFASYTDAEAESDPLTKIMKLSKSISSADEYIDTLGFGHSLYAKGESTYESDRDTIASLKGKLDDAKREASMRVVVKNDSNGSIQRVLSTLLSKEGFMLSDTSYAYVVTATVQQNKIKHEETITATPGISVTVNNGAETIFNYSKNFDRISGFAEAEALVDSRIYSAIEKELNNTFISEFQNSLK